MPSETTNDWYFEDRDSIQACGNGVVESVKETGKVVHWSSIALLESIQGSIREFGLSSVPNKHTELWR